MNGLSREAKAMETRPHGKGANQSYVYPHSEMLQQQIRRYNVDTGRGPVDGISVGSLVPYHSKALR